MKYAWIASVLLLAAGPASAMWKMPENVPVERLVKNVTAFTEAHPQDAQGWYVLGRIHSLALVLGAREIGVYGADQDDTLPSVDHQFHAPNEGEKPTSEQLRAHASAALTAFQTSLDLEPSARTHLGIAYTLEAAAPIATSPPPTRESGPTTVEDLVRYQALVEKLGSRWAVERDAAEKALAEAGRKAFPVIGPRLDDADPERRTRLRRLVGRLWTEAAIDAYWLARALALRGDLARGRLPIRGLTDLVSHEASVGWIRLVEARGPKPEEEARLELTRRLLHHLRAKPAGIITPIVFPLDRARPLTTLLAADDRAHFDLDGDLRREWWPWVRGDTAILVWDPEEKGRITSGRQLFGSVTWWMLWRDGYQALDALDDDRDGRVAGKELAGLAVWRDANRNGLSEAGEVVPVAKLGIRALGTRPTHRGTDGPSHARGLELADGRILPTYDWLADPAQAR